MSYGDQQYGQGVYKGGVPVEYQESYLWDFDDGETSTEKDPDHVWKMPGTYEWTCTKTDNEGNVTVTSGTARIYDWHLESGVYCSDRCYRSAAKLSQGVGITEFGNDAWLWPAPYYGASVGHTDENEAITVVENDANGKFYRIGEQELWTDRTDNYGAGTEIDGHFKPPERTAVAGEYQELEHVENHLHIRPWFESYRNASGYGSDGFRTAHAFGVRIYENGEPTTPIDKISKVPRYGDYLFRKRVEARRLELEYLFDTAAWRVIKIQEKYMGIDKEAGPLFDYSSERQYQDEFRGPDLWVSRDRKRPILNRASGSNMTGSYDATVTGPDSQTNSAVSMVIASSLTATLASLTGDFTLSFWLYGFAIFPAYVLTCAAGAGTLYVKIHSVGGVRKVSFDDGVNSHTRPLSWTSGWVHIAIKRTGYNIVVYENGVKIYVGLLANSTVAYGGSTVLFGSTIATFFDFRRIPTAISDAAIAYYYDQVVNNGKQCAFLPINR